MLIAEHSMCQPGRPSPHGESHVGSPGLRRLPEDEVLDVLLLVLVVGDAVAAARLRQVDAARACRSPGNVAMRK